ncbi:MAG: transposase [bacterium]|nr:transposase [bacterium]
MRKEKFVVGEYYHSLNRGNGKQPIFFEDRDMIRFLFSILYFQSPVNLFNISRQVSHFAKNQKFKVPEDIFRKIIKSRYVELTAFILMPNHFHLTVKELEKGGISKYMQRILNSHTKYRNAKNKSTGHLFQGPFKSIHVEDDPQLLYLSAYIHNNVRELKGWEGKEELYPWSSFQDYVGDNRWGELLKTDIIKNQFKNAEEYKLFVKNSGAKEKC